MKLSKVITRMTSLLMAFSLAITATMLPHLQHSVSADIDESKIVAEYPAVATEVSRTTPDESMANPIVDVKEPAVEKTVPAEPVSDARLTIEQEDAMVRTPADFGVVTSGKQNLPNVTKDSGSGVVRPSVGKQNLPSLGGNTVNPATELKEVIYPKLIGGAEGVKEMPTKVETTDDSTVVVSGKKDLPPLDPNERDSQNEVVADDETGEGSDDPSGDEPAFTPTPTPTAEPTAEPTATATPTPSPEPTATPLPTATPTPTPTIAYTYKEMKQDYRVYNTKKVNVRSLPSTDGQILGTLSENTVVRVTGQCNETKWYRIEFKTNGNKVTAYVHYDYLTDKPEPTPTPTPTNTPTPTPTVAYTFKDMNADYVVFNTTDTVNVRLRPSIDGAAIGKLALGTAVHVTGQCNETKWYRIDYKTEKGTETAYVSNDYLTEKTDEPANPSGNEPSGNDNPQPTATPTPTPIPYTVEAKDLDMYMTADDVRIRSTPEIIDSNILGKGKKGSKYHVTGKTTYKNETWYQVSYEDGKAYIYANYLSENEPKVSGEDLIFKLFTVSVQHKDLPYTHGASWAGTDCCGYVYILYKEVLGIDLGRTTASQMSRGKKISWDEARPGDIVCTLRDPYAGGDHSGLYIGKVKDPCTGQMRYYYLSQAGNHIHLNYMEGHWNGAYYQDRYAPYRVTNLTSSKSAQQIFDYLLEHGVTHYHY